MKKGNMVMVAIVLVLGVTLCTGSYIVCQDGRTCNPIAASNATVVAADNQARFTVLTDSLVRMQYRMDTSFPFEDRQTMFAWNRDLPVPKFSVSTNSDCLVIQTKTLTVTYNMSAAKLDPTTGLTGGAFPRDSLSIFHAPGLSRNTEWTPRHSTAGNLYGTIHDLDMLNGWQDLNCTRHTDWILHGEGIHCVFGVLSTEGWAIVDDSHSVVFDPVQEWIAPQLGGSCDVNSTEVAIPCFEDASLGPQDEDGCVSAGCCWQAPPPQVAHLWWSESRKDHFTSVECSGCSNEYVDLGPELVLVFERDETTTPLYLFWSETALDNVVSSIAPKQSGYQNVSYVGSIYSSASAAHNLSVKLWYSASNTDHWTTASEEEENEAKAQGYEMVAALGFTAPPSKTTVQDFPPCSLRRGSSDLYFFGHGLDYPAALKDLTKIAGYAPIPRRHWLGTSWSYWDEAADSNLTMSHVNNLKAMGPIGIDTHIWDMQWHIRPMWGAYTWDTSRYPDVAGLVQWVKAQGLATGANFHDENSVQWYETHYADFARAMGYNPADNISFTFDIQNKTYCTALQSTVMDPLYSGDAGLDMVWTDWQQGLVGATGVANLNPTILLNHYRFHHFAGSGYRGVLHSRFGGWGNHRYPSLFGGDVNQSWESLQFMVWMNQEAANALAGYWAQETMQAPKGNQELFTRVIALSSWSPVFTFWGNTGMDDCIWDLNSPFKDAVIHTLHQRSRTLPLRYTLSREFYDTGVAMVRPMYYTYPTNPDAYNLYQQFTWGPDVLVAPITQASSNPQTTYISSVTVSVPPEPTRGWFHFENGSRAFTDASTTSFSNHTVQANISTVPVYVRGGSILPLIPDSIAGKMGASKEPFTNIEWRLYPLVSGLYAGAASLYEDDGLSTKYMQDSYLNTTLVLTSSTSSNLALTLQAVHTAPDAGATNRTYLFNFLSYTANKPQSITIDSSTIPPSQSSNCPPTNPGSWAYTSTQLCILLDPLSVSDDHHLQITI